MAFIINILLTTDALISHNHTQQKCTILDNILNKTCRKINEEEVIWKC